MTNMAQLTFRVEFHGSFWLVTDGTNYRTVRAGSELCNLLSGHTRLVANAPRPLPPHTETIDEYLARGGTVNRVRYAPPDHDPEALAAWNAEQEQLRAKAKAKQSKPKPIKIDTSNLSLKDLGFE